MHAFTSRCSDLRMERWFLSGSFFLKSSFCQVVIILICSCSYVNCTKFQKSDNCINIGVRAHFCGGGGGLC